MTPRRHKLLRFITEQIATTGCSPTFREMAAHMLVASPSVVYRMVDALVDNGFLARMNGCARGLKITQNGAARLGFGCCETCGQSLMKEL